MYRRSAVEQALLFLQNIALNASDGKKDTINIVLEAIINANVPD